MKRIIEDDKSIKFIKLLKNKIITVNRTKKTV